MSQVNSQPNQSVAEKLRAALAPKPAQGRVEIVRAPKPLSEKAIDELFLPDSVEHSGTELAGLENHIHNRKAKAHSGKDHGDKTYNAARAQCAPKKGKN